MANRYKNRVLILDVPREGKLATYSEYEVLESRGEFRKVNNINGIESPFWVHKSDTVELHDDV